MRLGGLTTCLNFLESKECTVGNEEALKLIGDAGFTLATVSANIFVVMYAVVAPWWKTPFGRHMFFFMLAVALVLDNATAVLLWPDYPGKLFVRAILYPGLGLVLLWRVIILVDVQMIQPWRERRAELRRK